MAPGAIAGQRSKGHQPTLHPSPDTGHSLLGAVERKVFVLSERRVAFGNSNPFNQALNRLLVFGKPRHANIHSPDGTRHKTSPPLCSTSP